LSRQLRQFAAGALQYPPIGVPWDGACSSRHRGKTSAFGSGMVFAIFRAERLVGLAYVRFRTAGLPMEGPWCGADVRKRVLFFAGASIHGSAVIRVNAGASGDVNLKLFRCTQ